MPAFLGELLVFHLHVRDGIVSGALRWGEKLGESGLASELGVSRTPVREALRNLAADGYVELRLNAGAQVRRWDADEVNSSFEVRADIEGNAALRCAGRIGAHDLYELEGLCDAMEGATDAGERSCLNRTLHMRILRISGVAHAEKIVTQLSDLAVLTMTYQQFTGEDTARSDSDHRLLMRAFRLGDGALAQAVMRVHILSAAATLEEQRRGFRSAGVAGDHLDR
ncbi:GntR family transcriptional regulator [Salipiger pallidus]|uniref:GntR family transcriptional regulator n=1 Tax=Salipiger pallidus TaxID=1775170 RepID=A0A8J2ZPW7_9RHOB|nr:GntR family transcriptional regulator [Salipiger pallidus]GGG87607.1 GntR family transcriptional regulator [Salipiger pallidus]